MQAGNALASANAAAASQQSALECAENACRCSSDAGISAQEAATSASSALSSAQNASSSAERAEQAAERAEEVVGGDFATRSDLENHVNNKENPHGVTRGQIGAASAEDLSAHTADTTNPHEVTAEQVGAVAQAAYDAAIKAINDTLGTKANVADLAKYLPIDGSAEMIGNIKLNGNALQLSDDQKYANGVYFDITEQSKGARFMARRGGKNRLFYFNANEVPLANALNMWYYDDGTEA